jgi:hypothetical protein
MPPKIKEKPYENSPDVTSSASEPDLLDQLRDTEEAEKRKAKDHRK